MKENLKKFNKKFKEDFKSLIKNHWLSVIGFIVAFILPIGHLIGMTIHFGEVEKQYSLTIWLIPLFILIVFIYIWKIRSIIKKKLTINEQVARTDIDKLNTASFGLLKVADFGFTIFGSWVLFIICKNAEKVIHSITTLTMVISICMTIGCLCFIIDSFISIGEKLPNE